MEESTNIKWVLIGIPAQREDPAEPISKEKDRFNPLYTVVRRRRQSTLLNDIYSEATRPIVPKFYL